MNLATHMREAWPNHAAKEIARAGQVSVRQAKRDLATGRVPRRRFTRVITAIDQALARRQARLQHLRQQLEALLDQDPPQVSLDAHQGRRAGDRLGARAAPFQFGR